MALIQIWFQTKTKYLKTVLKYTTALLLMSLLDCTEPVFLFKLSVTSCCCWQCFISDMLGYNAAVACIGRRFVACHSTIPLWSVFLAVTFPSRGHSSGALTRGSHQQWAAKRKTLTGRGIRADWPLTLPSATSLPLGRKSLSKHMHTRAHTHKTHKATHTCPNRTDPTNP